MNRPLSPSEQDNQPRWTGQKPFYEVWYFKFNLVAERKALWLRYTLLSPRLGPALAELWAIFFDTVTHQHVALKQSFPISQFASQPEQFGIQIGAAQLTQNQSHGAIETTSEQISWALNYEPNQMTYYHAPPLLMQAPLPKTKVCTPQSDLRYCGHITVNGATYAVEDAPGMQGHIWGTQHAHNWAWAHCNTFEEAPNTVLEALSGQIKVGPWLTPPLSPIYVRYKGQRYCLNQYRHLLGNRSDFSPGTWHFAAYDKQIGFKGQLSASLNEDVVGVEYTDPDGSHRYCYNTKIGHAQLDILLRQGNKWEIHNSLQAHHTAAIEWVQSEPLPGIPIRI